MPRKLRIAVSAFFGVLTLALCVLWVRSYAWYDFDYVPLTSSTEAHISSYQGSIAIAFAPRGFTAGGTNLSWQGGNVRMNQLPWTKVAANSNRRITARWLPRPDSAIDAPYWSLVAACALATAIPWWHFTFSLRALLIATTLIAAMLGLAVWAAR